jgi:hypothetical protein
MTSTTEQETPRIPVQAHAGGPIPIPEDQAGYMIATAVRAPSVHNTQALRPREAGPRRSPCGAR